MSGSRRGLLGGLAALGMGGGSALAEARSGLVGMQPEVAVSPMVVGQRIGDACVEPARDPRWSAFREAMDAAWQGRAAIERRLSLTGGVPPGVAACRSWRPWFQVVAVERWRAEHLPDMTLVERGIRVAIFGPEGEVR